MTIRIICVGKLKERYFTEAVAEYGKRLGRYAKLEIVEVADERTPDRMTAREREQILDKEAKRLLPKIAESDYCIVLAIDGKAYDSEGFAKFLDKRMNEGNSRLSFVIGGSLGLGEAVLSRADARISFSKMTFPHQLMRVILAEQLYRSFRILRGEPYHK